MSEEIWMEVHNTVQEVTTKTSPKKKECKKANWVFEKALQIAEKRTEVKGKGERERYTQLNAEFQRKQGEIRKPSYVNNAKKKKKNTGENNRIGKTRDLFKKIEGNILCKDGHSEGQK